ncbi:MAG TPA: ATP-dependent zinc metalloprotease FtsH, partial [Candidatus Manganitrophaceae bacterium]|nr:ATP-dependent zinc metalloprotease FtsH [Candidatus Manganitrophaceae bacterium]
MAQKDFSGWSLFIILFMITILPFFFFSPQKHPVSYSEFKQWLNEGKVSEVVISDKVIQGTRIESGKSQPFSTVRVDDPTLIGLLDSKKIKYTGEIQNTWLRDILLFWVLPTMVIIFIWSLIAKRAGGAGQSFMAFGRAHAKVFEQKDVKVSFDDVAGADEPKEELIEIVDFLRAPERFQRLGGKIPKGVLLIGPPGTGKTLLARAVAGEAKVPFFSMSGSEFVEMFVGVGAARVRDLFSQAQQKAPCIIFIDELDALGRARGSGMLGGHAEQDQTLNQLLVEMDGFDTRKGVIIMAATNRPEILDTALLRPGRFDRQILVDRPDIREREEILQVHTRGVKLDASVDLKVLAARTPGFVGADLANVVNEAALLAARKNKEHVEMADFEEAINRVTAGLEKKKRVMSKKEKDFVAYHESGHALVAELVPNADRVHRISIIPRGIAALGYTLQLPTEDRYLMTRNEL